jgi:hypothetical protein
MDLPVYCSPSPYLRPPPTCAVGSRCAHYVETRAPFCPGALSTWLSANSPPPKMSPLVDCHQGAGRPGAARPLSTAWPVVFWAPTPPTVRARPRLDWGLRALPSTCWVHGAPCMARWPPCFCPPKRHPPFYFYSRRTEAAQSQAPPPLYGVRRPRLSPSPPEVHMLERNARLDRVRGLSLGGAGRRRTALEVVEISMGGPCTRA